MRDLGFGPLNWILIELNWLANTCSKKLWVTLRRKCWKASFSKWYDKWVILDTVAPNTNASVAEVSHRWVIGERPAWSDIHVLPESDPIKWFFVIWSLYSKMEIFVLPKNNNLLFFKLRSFAQNFCYRFGRTPRFFWKKKCFIVV